MTSVAAATACARNWKEERMPGENVQFRVWLALDHVCQTLLVRLRVDWRGWVGDDLGR